jgi:hypothetical protein
MPAIRTERREKIGHEDLAGFVARADRVRRRDHAIPHFDREKYVA